jgi:two-component system, sensor histidine kinase YesM
MKTSLKKREFSLFIKVVIVFLIVILPIYIFSLQFIIGGKNDVRREIIQASNSKLGLYLNTLEGEFFYISKLQTRLQMDSNLRELSRHTAVTGKWEQSRLMWEVQGKLEEMRDISKYVKEASVYIPSINKKISSSGIEDINRIQYEEIRTLSKQKAYPFTYSSNNIYMVVPSHSVNYSTEDEINPSYIIFISISEEKITDGLMDFFSYEKGGALFIGDRYGLDIRNNIESSLLEELTNLLGNNNYTDHYIDMKIVKLKGRKYIVSSIKSHLLNSTLAVYQSEEYLLSSLERYRVWVWLITLLTIVVVILFSIWIKRMIVKPLDKLIRAFNSLDEGDTNISVSYDSNDEFGYLYKRFNKMCKKLSMLIKEVYEEKIHTKNAELKQLQYQINPHFLYNCLFIVNRMTKMHDEEGVIKLTQHLGNYYQFVTRSSSDEIPLFKEVSHVKEYLEIQAFRFSRRIRTQMEELPEEYYSVTVPRLIFQPIVENAYNHGLKDKIKDGLIYISYEKEGRILKLSVEDNGDGLTGEQLENLKRKLNSTDSSNEITGLINVHRRLRIRYGQQGGVTVSRGKLGGLRVQLNIILEEGDSNEEVVNS